MKAKNYTEVVIDGQMYTLGGYEDAVYLQQVAAYINGRIADLRTQNGYAKQPQEMKNVMLCLNLADDYYKKKKETDELYRKLEKQEQDLYGYKHDIISYRKEVESLQAKIDALEKELKNR